jgi:hypothetical protein
LAELHFWPALHHVPILQAIFSCWKEQWIWMWQILNSNFIAREINAVNTAVSAIYLIWQHVSTLEGHLQVGSIKYVKGLVHNCMAFWTEVLVLHTVW